MANYTRVRISDGVKSNTPIKQKDGSYAVSSRGFVNRTPGSYVMYDEENKKYYAKPLSNAIPVMLTDTGGRTPALDKTVGYYTVGKQYYGIDKPVGSAVLFDRDTNKLYEPTNPTNDYAKQLRAFEAQYRNTQAQTTGYSNMVADGKNPNQINSLTDVMINFGHNTLTALDTGKVNPFLKLRDDAFNMVDNLLLKPLTSDDLSGWDKTKILFNNSMVNLGETVDLVTGAGLVKSLIMGGPDGAVSYFNSTEQTDGRVQYDWDTNLFKVNVPVLGELSLADMVLEVISDPTTWITLGLSGALKSGSKGLSEIITTSVRESGGEISEATTKKLVKVIGNRIKAGTDDTIIQSIQKGASTVLDSKELWRGLMDSATDLSKKADDVVQFSLKQDEVSNFTKNFADNITKNAKLFADTRDYKLINSLKGINDAANTITKGGYAASMYTSNLGLGHLPYTILKHGGSKAVNLFKAWENKTLKSVIKEKPSIFRTSTISQEFLDNLDNMFKANNMVLNDEVSATVIKPLANTLTKDTFEHIARILQNPKTLPMKALEDVNKYLSELSGGEVDNIVKLKKFIENDKLLGMYDAGTRNRFNNILNAYNNTLENIQIEQIAPHEMALDAIKNNIDITSKQLGKTVGIDEFGVIIRSDELDTKIIGNAVEADGILEAMAPKINYANMDRMMAVNYELSEAMLRADSIKDIKIELDAFNKEYNKFRAHISGILNEFKIRTTNTDMPNTSKAAQMAKPFTESKSAEALIAEHLYTQGLGEDVIADKVNTIVKSNAVDVIKNTKVVDAESIDMLQNLKAIVDDAWFPAYGLPSLADENLKVEYLTQAFADAFKYVADNSNAFRGSAEVRYDRLINNKIAMTEPDIRLLFTTLKDYNMMDTDPTFKQLFRDIEEVYDFVPEAPQGLLPYPETLTPGYTLTGLERQNSVLTPIREKFEQLGVDGFTVTEVQELVNLLKDDEISKGSLSNFFEPYTESLNKMVEDMYSSDITNSLTKDLVSMTRALTYQLSDAASMDLVLGDGALNNMSAELYHNVLGGAMTINTLSNIRNIPEGETALLELVSINKTIKADLLSFMFNKDIINNIVDNKKVPIELRAGVKDTVAASHSFYESLLNSDSIDITNTADLDYVAETMAKHTLDKATAYTLKSTGKYNMHFDRMMNTPDTKLNVENMLSALEKNAEFGDIKKVLDDDIYTNVYYSVATDSGNGQIYGITFGTSADDLVTVRNADIVPAHSHLTARENFGMTVDEFKKYYAVYTKENPGYSTNDFYLRGIGDRLNVIKTESSAQGKQIRFISANNKADALQLDMKLNKSFRRYNTKQYLGDTEDILQMLRRSEGQLSYEDATYSAVKESFKNLVQKVQSIVDSGDLDGSGVSLVANINTEFIARAQKLSSTLDKYLKGVSTPEPVAEMLSTIRKPYIEEAVVRLDELIKSVKYTLADIESINAPLRSTPIDEATLTRVLGYQSPFMNTTRILNIPSLKEVGEVPILNLKKRVDIPASSFWYDMDVVYEMKMLNNYDIYAVWEGIKKLERIQNNIVNTPLVNKLDADNLRKVRNALVNVINRGSLMTKELDLFITASKDMDNNKQLFTQAYYLLSSLIDSDSLKNVELMMSDVLRGASTPELKGSYSDIFQSLLQADTVVFNKGFRYTFPEAPTVVSSLMAPNSDLNLAHTLSKELTKVQDSIDDINLSVSITEDILHASNASAPALLHRNKQVASLVEPIQSFKNLMSEIVDDYLGQYQKVVDTSTSLVEIELAKQKFSINRQHIDGIMSAIADRHALDVAESVLMLSPEDFTGHLYKNALGKLVVNTNSDVVKKLPAYTLIKFEETLKAAEALGVKHTIDGDYIKVWFNKKAFTDVELDALATKYADFSLGDTYPRFMAGMQDIGMTRETFDELYKKILQKKGPEEALEFYNANLPRLLPIEFSNVLSKMNDYMGDGFMMSSYNASTVSSFQNLSSMFDEDAIAESLDLTYVQGKGMLDATFNNSFIGDYGEGARTVYEFMSPNILVNMMTGINMVKSKLDYVTDKLNWYYNPANSFANFVQHSAQVRGIDLSWTDIKKAFDDNGYILHTLKEDKHGNLIVRELPFKTLNDFNNAIADVNVSYSTRAMMQSLQDTTNVKNIPIQEALRANKKQPLLWKMYKEEIKPLYVTGYLSMDPSTWIRNYTDGSMKGLIQTRDIGYVRKLMQIHEANKQWDEVRIDIITKEKNLAPKNIHNYFKEVPQKFAGLDEQMFLTMLEIKNHSATSMSQSQLKWYKDNFKVIRSYAPTEIADLDVKQAVKIFEKYSDSDGLEHVVRQNVYSELVAAVGEETAKVLINLRKYYSVPKEGAYLVNKLRKTPIIGDWINFNAGKFSTVEDDIRMALALYYVEDLGYNVSMAVDEVVRSQFDYSKGRILSFIENIFPFTTFKAYNTQFWLSEVPKFNGALAWIEDVVSASTDGYTEDDIIETARLATIRAKVASGDYSYDTKEEQEAWETYMADIDKYKGVDSIYAEQHGYMRINDKLTIKVGNSLFDVVNMLIDPVGTFADSLFAPIKSVYTLSKAIKEDDEGIPELLLTEDYAVSALVPVLGVVYNKIKAGWKNHVASDYLIASVFPGMFGILKEPSHYRSRPIGYDWFNQTEEYKATHQFVVGVSYVPSWVTKNPTSYVDVYGRLLKLGYTEQEAGEMLSDGWYINTDYELRNIDDYDNMPKVIMYNYAVYERTLKELQALGWSASEARELMLKGVYYDEAGNRMQDTGGTGSKRKKGFRKAYYKRTYARKFKKFRYPRNTRIRSVKSYGYRKIYRVKISNRTRNALSLRSSYPSAYRNIIYANRRNMYKGLYAKYGASRMTMRQNQRGYSNASITRLRRKELQNNKYRERRSF